MPARAGPLEAYRAKRDFRRTPEPAGAVAPASGPRLAFVVQRHAARRLHYDLRLEWAGVLKSWAVTRGPSLDPADKRLAVEVEDHPLDYADFEGVIPPPGYGAGSVQLWDRGAWAPLDVARVEADLAAGELKFVLSGQRLRGGFVLVRLKPRAGKATGTARTGEAPGRHNWLLIKERDSMARPGEGDAVLREAASIASGRTLAQIAAAGTQPPKPAAPPKASAPPKPRRVAAPRRSPNVAEIPEFIPPQLCLLVTAPPTGPEWLHELKLDGYRLQLRVVGGQPRLRTRTGLDWTARFPAIVRAAAALPDSVIDGEAVALDPTGQPSFAALQATLAGEASAPVVLFAFDLLAAGRDDLRALPLTQRKARLAQLLPKNGGALRLMAHFDAPGAAVLASACKLSQEGVVSKRRDGPYRSGRGEDWVKAKCRGRDEFMIGGWSRGAGGALGALLVGATQGTGVAYLGRVGTGYDAATRRLLDRALGPIARPASPFAGRQPERLADVRWVAPELVVEVAHSGFTEAGLLRHASFVGLREDKPAAMVTPPPAPIPAPTRRAPAPTGLTHPERVLWPATADQPAITKADLAAYYAKFADRILAAAGGRALAVLRAPDGIAAELFFQRHAMRGQSPLLGVVTIPDQARPFMRIDDPAALIGIAQMAGVELHPSGARADAPERPDRLVFDLDPDPSVGFGAVIAGARALRTRLEALGLTTFPRVTGGKGLHLVVPLAAPRKGPPDDWTMAKQFARAVCAVLERDAPDRYTTALAKRARTGRVFLDYLRNDLLSTAIASWSPRGRPGAPVARPIGWSAVKPGLDPAGWGLAAMLAGPLPRDPWSGFEAARGSLRDAAKRLASG